MKQVLKKYFNLFSKKDLKNISVLFSQKIILADWENKVYGKKNVISFNKKIFKKFKKINVKIINIYENKKKRSFACKIIVSLNGLKIKVVDLIYFNKNKEIIKIEAYKL